MKYTHKPRRAAAKSSLDPAEKLRAQAIKGRDKGDGHGTDWILAASDALLVAYHCLDRAGDDPRAKALLEHAHGAIYDRWMGNPDDGLAMPAEPRGEPSDGPSGPTPDHAPPGR